MTLIICMLVQTSSALLYIVGFTSWVLIDSQHTLVTYIYLYVTWQETSSIEPYLHACIPIYSEDLWGLCCYLLIHFTFFLYFLVFCYCGTSHTNLHMILSVHFVRSIIPFMWNLVILMSMVMFYAANWLLELIYDSGQVALAAR